MKFDYNTILEPALFWFWNVTLDEDAIQRRLDEFCAKGIRAIYVHPMPDSFRPDDFYGGMEIPYLSDRFFELIAITCERVRERGMLMWLYDEGGWPSGMAGGAVVAANPNYSAWALSQQEGQLKAVQPYLASQYPDIMNPEATRCFIEVTHERYRSYIGHEFGRTVPGIFTDEPRLAGRIGTSAIPWTPFLPDAFGKQHGYALDEVLLRLFERDPVDEETLMIRRDYLNTVSTLAANNFYRPIRQWCEQWGLMFEGHHSGENEFSRHGQYFGDFMQQARHYHIPGIDTIWRQIFPHQPGGNYVGLASSISWLRGERCALSESFSIYGAGLTLEQMYWVCAFQIVRGVNKIGFMPSMENKVGSRRVGMCTDISPQTPLWRDFDLLVNVVGKAAKLSASGQAQPRVGMFYRSELVAEAQAAEFDAVHERLCDRIQDAMTGLAFVGVEDLREAEVVGDSIHVGALQLATLVVHVDGPLTPDENEALASLACRGARLLWIGERTGYDLFRENIPCAGAASNIEWFPDLEAVDLSNFSPLILDCPLRGVRLLALQEGERSSLLFFNQNSDPVTFSFRLRENAKSTRLREYLLDDEVSCVFHPFSDDGINYHLQLAPGQMRALVSAEEVEPIVETAWHRGEVQPLEAVWQVAETESYFIRDDIEIETVPGLKTPVVLGDYTQTHPYFSGSLVYETNFTHSSTEGQRVLLELGAVFYAAEVTLNGLCCGRRGWAPFLFDITSALQEGDNQLQIRITNTLANQWARPEIRERDFRLWPNMYLEKTSTFLDDSLHAGLAGPVTLHTFSPSS